MALLYAITASAAARPDSSMIGVFKFNSESSLWKFLVILSRSERIMRTCFSRDSTEESLILSMRSLLPADDRAEDPAAARGAARGPLGHDAAGYVVREDDRPGGRRIDRRAPRRRCAAPPTRSG